jgi:transposase InsO family protein
VNHLKRRIPAEPVTEGPPRRGCGQRREREQEQEARRHAIDVGKLLVERGWNWADTADLLGVAARTLRDWRLDLDRQNLRVVSLGRPLKGAKPEERNQVIRFVDELGPGVGLPTLRDSFPDFARAELEDILRRYRRVWRKRNRQSLHVLHWTQPGAVWAIDFHGPRPLIDGLYPHLLAVRDLASGQQLLWQPVADVCAPTVREALTSLFVVHGAPLVLKSDNGSAFIAEGVRELAENFAVKILYSPPRMPSYNGSIEAGIGSLTSRTEQHAARHGRPGHWTWDDAEAARLEANATARPKGPLGPSPDQMWQARTPIAPAQRTCFSSTVAQLLEKIEATQGSPANTQQLRAASREAIHLALVEHGYLYTTRRSIPLPITMKKAADIT